MYLYRTTIEACNLEGVSTTENSKGSKTSGKAKVRPDLPDKIVAQITTKIHGQ